MKTLSDGERIYCSFCGTKLIEFFSNGMTYSKVRCPRYSSTGKGILKSLFGSPDFNHDYFIGATKKQDLFDPVTGERIK